MTMLFVIPAFGDSDDGNIQQDGEIPEDPDRPPGISHGAFELRMDNVWFCKVLLLFQVESKADSGWKRHSCAFVSVLEEYSGPSRPGNYILFLEYLVWLFCLDYLFDYLLLSVHMLLITLCLFCRMWQLGWISATQRLFTSAACSLKSCMFCPLPQYWEGWPWCLSATLEPSRSPCANRPRTFLAHHATRRMVLVTAIHGGTSTVTPWSGRQANKMLYGQWSDGSATCAKQIK